MAESILRNPYNSPSVQLIAPEQMSEADVYAATGGANQNSFSKGLRSGILGIDAGAAAKRALEAEVAGDEAAYQRNLRQAAETQQQAAIYAPRVQSLRDVHGVGDALNYAGGVIGQGVVTMAPSLAAAALTRGKSLLAKGVSQGAALVPAYQMEAGEQALNQYNDPAQAAASPELRYNAMQGKAGVNMFLESAVPGVLGRSLLARPTGSLLGHTFKQGLEEGTTELAQQAVQNQANKYINPESSMDAWDYADAFAGGALSGGAMAGTLAMPSHLINKMGGYNAVDKVMPGGAPPNPYDGPELEAGKPVPLGGPTPGAGAQDLGAGAQDLGGIDLSSGTSSDASLLGGLASRVKNMTEEAKTSTADFLRKAFSTSPAEDAAAPILLGDNDKSLIGATVQQTAENLRQRAADNIQRAKDLAASLKNNPKVSESVKTMLDKFGGNFTDAAAQHAVAKAAMAQDYLNQISESLKDLLAASREKLTDISNTALEKSVEHGTTAALATMDAAGDMYSKGKDVASGLYNGAKDAVGGTTKKFSLMDVDPRESAKIVHMVFNNLTPEAMNNPEVRKNINQVANTLVAFSARTGDLRSDSIPTLLKLKNAMTMFKDPEALVAQIQEYTGAPRDSESFVNRIRAISSAERDSTSPTSFLQMALTPEAQQVLTGPKLRRLAQVVDNFSMSDGKSKEVGDNVLTALSQAFGGREQALHVVDYYANLNHSGLGQTLSEEGSGSDAAGAGPSYEGAGTDQEADYDAGNQGVTIRDSAPRGGYKFADTSGRPFWKNDGAELSNGRRVSSARQAAKSEVVANGAYTPISMRQYVEETGGNPDQVYADTLKDLDKRIGEHQKRVGQEPSRAPILNELLGKRELLKYAREQGGSSAALDQLQVLKYEGEPDDTAASDADLAFMRKHSSSRDNQSSLVRVKMKDGSTVRLNAQQMWKRFAGRSSHPTDPDKKQMFHDALAAVLKRDDVAGLEEKTAAGLRHVVLDTKTGENADKARRVAHIESTRAAEGIVNNAFALYSKAMSKFGIGKSLSEFKNKADAAVESYITADTHHDAEDIREEIENRTNNALTYIRQVLDATQALKEAKGAPKEYVNEVIAKYPKQVIENARRLQGDYEGIALWRAKEQVLRDAKSKIMDVKHELAAEQREAHKSGVPGAEEEGDNRDIPRTRLNEESGVEPRVYEEDTGAKVGSDPRGRQTASSLSEEEVAAFNSTRGRRKADPQQAAAEKTQRDTTAIDNTNALSPSALNALHDVLVKGNTVRIDTAEKAMALAAMLPTAVAQLRAMPELTATQQKFLAAIDGSTKNPHLDKVLAKLPEKTRDEIKKYSFVGAVADPKGAARAEKLFSLGAPKGVVWRMLGWFRGPDGKLRKEVRSPALRMRIRSLVADKKDATVGDLIRGIPEFKKYENTELSKVRIMVDDHTTERDLEERGATGTYSKEDRRIDASSRATKLSVLLRATPPEKLDEIQRTREWSSYRELSAMLEAELKLDKHQLELDVNKDLEITILHELQHAIQQEEGFENGGNKRGAVISAMGFGPQYMAAIDINDYTAAADIEAAAVDKLRSMIGPEGGYKEAATKLYKNIIGEAEAFDTGDRMGLTAAEARSIRPALMSRTREFVKSLENTVALMLLDPRLTKSAMNARKGRPTSGEAAAKTREQLLAEIERIRGRHVDLIFERTVAQIGGSGSYSTDSRQFDIIEIATNAANPMSVAWHESLHHFFAGLTGDGVRNKLKADLLKAASAPHVVAQLRKLLAQHPAALEQLIDPEERLAYMYQFWAEGELTVGPTTKNIFTKLAEMFAKMLNAMTEDQRTEAVFKALHTGKFAFGNNVANVLSTMNIETVNEKLERASGPVGRAMEKGITGATDRLRNTNVPALAEIADLFHRESGHERGGLPFLQSRARQMGIYTNKISKLFAGVTEEQRREALFNLQNMKPPSNELEQSIRNILDELHAYMAKSGVVSSELAYRSIDGKRVSVTVTKPIRKIEGYFPRIWDRDAVMRNADKFKDAIVRNLDPSIPKGRREDAAQSMYDSIVKGRLNGSPDLIEDEHSLGFTPFAISANVRQMKFINKKNAHEFSEFQSKDILDIMGTYVQQAVHRAEYSRVFGPEGERLRGLYRRAAVQGATPEQLKDAATAVMALEGTLGYDFNPRIKSVMSGIMTYQNIILLPLALFSSLVDPLGIAVRSNNIKDAGAAFKYGAAGIGRAITDFVGFTKKQSPDHLEEMAKTMGLIDDQNMLEAMGQVYNSMHMGALNKKISNTFFRLNGMELWNKRMRIAGMVAAQRFIVKNVDNRRYMDELGLSKSDVVTMPDGTMALTRDQLEAAGVPKAAAGAMEKRIHEAVFKFVDGAVLRPNSAHRPVWGSDPRFMLIMHLKQFTFSFQNVINRRVNNEHLNGNAIPAYILLAYVPFSLVSGTLRAALTGTLPADPTVFSMLSSALDQSGIMGVWSFADTALEDPSHGNIPGAGLLGPTGDHLMTLAGAAMGDTSAHQAFVRSIPGGAALRGV